MIGRYSAVWMSNMASILQPPEDGGRGRELSS